MQFVIIRRMTMGKLKSIDKTAEKKGKLAVTAWQFVKFIIVSLLAFIVQFTLLNLLPFVPAISALSNREFHWFVFSYSLSAGGLAYAITSNTANITAQIVAFFVNRKKTFNANNSVAITLTIYIVFTVALICFAAWLNPVIKSWVVTRFALNEQLASNVATMACSVFQFIIYFPFDKILMKEKK